MKEAFETGDAKCIAWAMGVVARAKATIELACETGLFGELLYRSFSNRTPHAQTMLAVMQARGIKITARPHVALAKKP